MKWILLIIGLILTSSCSTTAPSVSCGDEISVVITESTISINDYTLNIENLEIDLERFGIKPFTNNIISGGLNIIGSSFEKENYPIAFLMPDDFPLDTIVVFYDRNSDNYSHVDICIGPILINNDTTINDIEKLMEQNQFKYIKYAFTKDSVWFDCSTWQNSPILQVGFKNDQIIYIELDLRKAPNHGMDNTQ